MPNFVWNKIGPVGSAAASDVNGFTNAVVTGCHRTAMFWKLAAVSTLGDLQEYLTLFASTPLFIEWITQSQQ
ncbi:hypothetical protein FM038_007945 [Shewanella eurypsychrophilus]|uniref:Uncharacterized protein n=1 Tax=Shewanella eurypsychrophilus TaxID=2593656 RepID=A0ABX6V400_9GAMM|nr:MULTISPECIES: hypothetical protein [Shewanella]QFU22086.1 hypothetical protein FS418_09525 [Shewanella sp. YLB-09]QPG57374.1 hypothetical protein FM038_007945 [Shewanella eurypsychrophilus]